MGTMGLLGADWQDKPRVKSSVAGKKMIYTQPQREGGSGYSYAERTIGQNPPPYMPDEYQRGKLLGRDLRKKSRAAFGKAFNSAPNSGGGYFNANPWAEPPGPIYVKKKDKPLPVKAWKPSHPPSTVRAYQCLSKIGRDYVPEPEALKVRDARLLSRSCGVICHSSGIAVVVQVVKV